MRHANGYIPSVAKTKDPVKAEQFQRRQTVREIQNNSYAQMNAVSGYGNNNTYSNNAYSNNYDYASYYNNNNNIVAAVTTTNYAQ